MPVVFGRGSCWAWLGLVAALLVGACGTSDPAAQRAAEVQAILGAHLDHETALLDILEHNLGDAPEAESQLARYLAEHDAEMHELCAKRRELEVDQTALATALRKLEPRMQRSFARRMALAERAPELMARDKVRTALATLDPL